MKKIFSTTVLSVLIACAMAQAPQRFSFQAVVRNNVNELLLNKPVGMKTTILQGNPNGTIVYQEFYYPNPQTNANGLVTLEIGSGFVLSGNFANINWANGPYFIKTEADPTGGSNYTITGTSQLMSVPYALHAKTAESITGGITETDPVFNAWDKSTGIAITEGQITDLQNYLTEESDPVFTAWDKSTGVVITESQITDLQNYLTEETDPLFNAWDKSTGITISESQITDLQNYLTEETDPDFNAWDKSTGIAITEGQITDLQDYLTEETDPVFTAWDKSTGVVITESQITDLQDYLTEEADGDPTNELQTVTQEDYQVTLSQGGGTFMTGVKSYTQAEIDAMTPYNGLTVINTTTNCVNYYILNNWYEACGTCTPQPTQANAGDDQSFTDNTVAVMLSANTPVQGTGLWSIVSGEGGSFDDASLASATFTGQPCTAYTLAWTITNTCDTSNDEVVISFFETPTVADAGNDTIVLGGDLSVNLNANTPEMGEGLWTILTGEGGTFDDATNPQALFTGQPYIEYILQWAIATVCDTTYDEVSVTFNPWQCGMPFTDSRDNQSYNTIQIGTQCWMAENLKYLPEVVGPGTGSNNVPYYYVYGYNGTSVSAAKATANYQTYGALYNWPASLTACPTGWHLPSDGEWTVLVDFLGGSSVAGGKMKTTGTTHWASPNTGATNSSGFSGLPGGLRGTDGSFTYMGDDGLWWSSTEGGAAVAWYRFLAYFNSDVSRNGNTKGLGFSARCVRDN